MEVFYEKAVLKNFAPQEMTVLESLFKKIAGVKACNFIKRDPSTVFSCEYCQMFKSTYFEKHQQTAAFWLF